MSHICPLCENQHSNQLCSDDKRTYFRCDRCHLVFVPKDFHLSHGDEKAIYEMHENNPDDEGYRHFLSRLMTPMLEYLPASGKGLDFGSGPGPTLSIMLAEQGHNMSIYDPYFANDASVLQDSYDFITTTEVVEHLSRPKEVFCTLFSLLKEGGVLGIMTKLIPSLENFDRWHYTNDPTHITFYAEETFHYLAQQYNYRAEIKRNDTIILLPN